ncbi:MAG TPA: hypothetical protein VIK84_02075 [Haloplasmataceae bacterium]
MTKGLKSKSKHIKHIITPVKLFVDGETEVNYFNRVNILKMFKNVSIVATKGNYDRYLAYKKKNKDKYVFYIEDIDGVCSNSKEPEKVNKYKKLSNILKNQKIFF